MELFGNYFTVLTQNYLETNILYAPNSSDEIYSIPDISSTGHI